MQGRGINAPIRKSGLIQVELTKRGRGRPKITLVKVVKINNNKKLIKVAIESMILDKRKWQRTMYVQTLISLLRIYS